MNKTTTSSDGKLRCTWSNATPEFIAYHDKEWGLPVKDEARLFEKLSLESFQSGLSWRTILGKRQNFREAFLQFDFHQVAKFTECDVERLLHDEGIVRHRGKIEAVINNANCAVELIEKEGSLASYFWRYEVNPTEYKEAHTDTGLNTSKALSKDLKKRGWKFVGPVTVYAFMQASGLINDHAIDCVVRAEVERARAKFEKPN